MRAICMTHLFAVSLCVLVFMLGACGRVGYGPVQPPRADAVSGGDQDSCAACTAQQVCVQDTCRRRCHDATSCGADEICASLGGSGGYCASAAIGGSGPIDVGGGWQEAQSGSYRVRGGVSPYGAGATGSSVQVRPAIE